ncbi:hypothetical protein IM40_01170 [Candidatus Paracaedimonas acanthamoebae]|nr:hypothetical protein IM40_01170 [Candidatus Paracaedimonas acanthamoebae]
MSSKLISYVLGCVFVLSVAQDLRASPQKDEEEPKPRQAGRRAKEASGYKAPHPSLAVADLADIEKKLQALAEEQKQQEEAVEEHKRTSSRGKNHTKNKNLSNKKTSRDGKTSKKTHIKQPLLSRAPVTIDVPLEEEVSSSRPLTTIIHPDSVIHPELPPVSPTILPDFPDISPDKTEKATSSSSPKHKTTKKKEAKKGNKKEEIPLASPSKGHPGKNYDPYQYWLTVPTKHPQIQEESLLLQAKDVFAPKELYPTHILLALAAGTTQGIEQNPITGKDQIVVKYNKVYIPELKMFLGFKIMEAGKLEDLKSKLLFDNFAQSEKVKTLLKLICIKGKGDFSKIIPTFMQKAQDDIQSLTHEHFHKSRIRIKRDEVEKRPEGNTLGEKYKSNYGIYEIFEEGNSDPIPNLRVRVAFSALK